MFDAYLLTNNKNSSSPKKPGEAPLSICIDLNDDRKSLPVQDLGKNQKPAQNLSQFKARLMQAKKPKKIQKNAVLHKPLAKTMPKRQVSPRAKVVRMPLLSQAYV